MATRTVGGIDKAQQAQAKQDAFNLRQRLAELQKNPVYKQEYDGGDSGQPDNTAFTNYQNSLTDLDAKIKAADLLASGFNADGTPIAPGMRSILDEEGNLLADWQYQAQLMDPSKLEGYNKFREMALQQGPSDWAKLAQQQNLMGKQDAIEAAQKAASTGQAQARSQMAMRGGFGSGARTSLARQGLKELMGQRQGAQRDYLKSNLATSLEDEKMKRDALGKFSSAEMDLNKYNTDLGNRGSEFNLKNRLAALSQENQYGMDTYKEQLDKWGAEKQADATRKAGGGGGKK